MNTRSHTPQTVVEWLSGLSDSVLAVHYGADMIDIATQLGSSGSVHDPHMEDGTLTAQVTATDSSGSSCEFHPQISLIGYPRRIITWVDHCDCDCKKSCEHASALVLIMREYALHPEEKETTQATAPKDLPSWEAALAPAIPQIEAGGQRRMALELEQIDAITGPNGVRRWRLSVLRENSHGDAPSVDGPVEEEWARTHIGWHTIARDASQLSVRSDQLNALRGLEALNARHNPRSRDMLLDRLPAELWAMLRRAANTGITFLHKLGEGSWAPVYVDDHRVSLGLDVAQSGDDYELHVVLDGDKGLEPFLSGWSLIGDPTHGVLRAEPHGAIRLTPLADPIDTPIRTLLERHPTLALPGKDLPRFFGLYAPFLRDRLELLSTDGSVDANESPVTRPWLRADFTQPGQVNLTTGISLTMAGHTARLDTDDARRINADPASADMLSDLRDLVGPTGERTLEGRELLDFASHALPELQEDFRVDVQVVGQDGDFSELTGLAELHIIVSDGSDGAADDDNIDEISTAEEESSSRPSADWFDLDIQVSINGEDIPIKELLAALVANQDYLILDSGSWLNLDRRELDPLRALVQEASTIVDLDTGHIGLSRWQLGLWEELTSSGIIEIESARWRRRVQGLLEIGTAPAPQVPDGVSAELRSYQVEGYAWLSALWDAGLGGILADDMGLGKTLQTLCLIKRLKDEGRLIHPTLVIAPTSVMAAWTGEAAKFVPDLSVVSIDETSRKSGQSLVEAIDGADVVVTSYTLSRLEADQFRAVSWSLLVLDEAQFVKNHEAKTYGVVRQLRAHMRLAITGTPLENSLMDLWSLLSIAAPGVFPDPKVFAESYVKPVETGVGPDQLNKLRRRIRPLMLRRTKGEVAAELPPKQEFVLPVKLGREHRRIYDRQLQAERMRTLGLLSEAGNHRIEILAALTRLRQLSLHPGLVDPASAAVASAKIDTLVDHLQSLAGENHRALVFSQFTSFLHLIRNRLTAEGITWEYLDGRTRHREDRVREFKEGNATAFLISLKAGGFGLTLTEADYVYVLDPWWNPAAEAQAIDRTHRIGQDKQVMVYRMVSTDTIEEKVMALQDHKRDLFDQVVGDKALASGAISTDDIRGLLE